MNKFLLVGTLAATSLLAACASTPKQAAPAPAAAPTSAAAPAAAARPAGAASVTGTWDLNVETPMGSRPMKLNAVQNGSALTGSIASPQGDMPITGTVNGSDIAFMMKVNAQGMDLQIDYKGVVEGNTMKGNAKFGEFGEGTFTGKKQ
jgi:hypothetical protein